MAEGLSLSLQPQYRPPEPPVDPLQHLQAVAAERDKEELAAARHDADAGPAKGPEQQPIYTVAQGDTPASIASRFDVSLTDLKRLNQNRIGDDGQIRIGAQLVLPPNAKTDPQAHGPRGKANGQVSAGNANSIEDKYGRPAWTQRYHTRAQQPSAHPAQAPEVKAPPQDTKRKLETAAIAPKVHTPPQQPSAPRTPGATASRPHQGATNTGATPPSVSSQVQEIVQQTRPEVGRVGNQPALKAVLAGASSVSSIDATPPGTTEQPLASPERIRTRDLRFASNEAPITLATTRVAGFDPDRLP
jgi:LysM repeat protein